MKIAQYLVALALVACSGNDSTPKDAGPEAGNDAGYPGPHSAPP